MIERRILMRNRVTKFCRIRARMASQSVWLRSRRPMRRTCFFDMEGYPLVPGGLEYLFGTWARNEQDRPVRISRLVGSRSRLRKRSRSRDSSTGCYARWKKNPAMHIYHYATYEVSAVRRLSTRHDTRQDEVDDLLRNNVFVDLYQIVRHAVRIGEDSYSIKSIETLYRPKRRTDDHDRFGIDRSIRELDGDQTAARLAKQQHFERHS